MATAGEFSINGVRYRIRHEETVSSWLKIVSDPLTKPERLL